MEARFGTRRVDANNGNAVSFAFPSSPQVVQYFDANGALLSGVPVVNVGSDGTSATSNTNPMPIAGPASAVVTASITRVADVNAYVVGDLIANSVTNTSVTPITLPAARANGVSVVGRRVRVKVNDPIWKAGSIRVHLFATIPTVTVGDNGVLNNAETYAFSESNYIGYCDVSLFQLTSDGFAKGFATFDFVAVPAAGTVNIYALLEARTALTPASAAIYTVSIEVLRD